MFGGWGFRISLKCCGCRSSEFRSLLSNSLSLSRGFRDKAKFKNQLGVSQGCVEVFLCR